jgi:hypothetical protein
VDTYGRDMMIEITENGSCIAVWDDSNAMQAIGDLEVTRLSDVEFDNKEQGWKVHFRNGLTLPGLYQQRIEALNAEISYVDDHLSEFGEWVMSQNMQQEKVFIDPSMS